MRRHGVGGARGFGRRVGAGALASVRVGTTIRRGDPLSAAKEVGRGAGWIGALARRSRAREWAEQREWRGGREEDSGPRGKEGPKRKKWAWGEAKLLASVDPSRWLLQHGKAGLSSGRGSEAACPVWDG
ncbi:hypothetical protein EJB05_27273, partial [Eragrostis curvula]